ncbi:M48 family metallopeptidase [Rhizorhabdus dicambivorans]|uniref:M48 family peptidase n=1 Tax=Rhizorhabdus dicambivorans TaxID=1850238 RepID=A0A2A4G120_9SPHN|nr:SprT family zinc-dependent metalloprotease [Rhizorhabdus dicambivorans]ATE63263.1 M48 family peptidase [Rhizorhabdus dicambivorans]PCE43477.1 M48 family peptidase [Rhizorhabdus dicambivorans]
MIFRRKPNPAPAPAAPDMHFAAGGRIRPLQVRRMAQARSMRLSVDPRDGGVRLILPARASLKAALKWVETKRDWIEQALDALPHARPIVPGMAVEVAGERLTIELAATGRIVRRTGDRLVVPEPADLLSARVIRWLKAQALRRLEAETLRYAERAGVTIGRVSIGDPRARWGSCSANGDIRYSWRLILAPPTVLEATVAHEVAHRLHMDHSADFHAAVERLLGRDPAAERAWLRVHGRELYWLGREA